MCAISLDSEGKVMQTFRHDFGKAWHKATRWGAPAHQAFFVALRYALTGDSGRFLPPKGSQSYRILKS